MKKMILILSFFAASGLYSMQTSVLDTKISEAKVKMDASKNKLDQLVLLIQQASQGGKDIESMKKVMALIALRRKEAEQYKQYQEEYNALVGQKTT